MNGCGDERMHRLEASLKHVVSKHIDARRILKRRFDFPARPETSRASRFRPGPQTDFRTKCRVQTSMFRTVPSAKIELSLGRSTNRVFLIAPALWHRSWVKSQIAWSTRNVETQFRPTSKSQLSVESQNAILTDPSLMPSGLDRNRSEVKSQIASSTQHSDTHLRPNLVSCCRSNLTMRF